MKTLLFLLFEETKKEYDLRKEAALRKPSSEWWKEEETYLDLDKP